MLYLTICGKKIVDLDEALDDDERVDLHVEAVVWCKNVVLNKLIIR